MVGVSEAVQKAWGEAALKQLCANRSGGVDGSGRYRMDDREVVLPLKRHLDWVDKGFELVEVLNAGHLQRPAVKDDSPAPKSVR